MAIIFNDKPLTPMDKLNEILRNQEILIDKLKRENAALKVKADMYDDLMTVRKLLDYKFPDNNVLYKP